MKTIVDSADVPAELRKWENAQAQIWMSHATLKRLTLMLSRNDEPEVLFVVGTGCESIAGPFSWSEASISVSSSVNPAGEAVFDITDQAAGFVLRCSSVTLVRAPATDFPTTFDNFLGE